MAMERSARREWAYDWLWILAWGIVSSVWCWNAAVQLGATFDESTDLVRGMEWWHDGSHHSLLRVGAMPLPMDVDTLPLYLWERWHGAKLDLDTDLERVLPWARAGTLPFWWILLIYGYLAGKRLAGPWGGRLTVALLACEPTMLAHASLATKDIAVSACLLALVYHFRAGREAGWFRRVGLPAFWFAAAMLAKASAVVFGPICLLMVEWERLVRMGAFQAGAARVGVSDVSNSKSRWIDWIRLSYYQSSPFRWDLFQAGSMALLLVFLYCGCDWRAEPSFVAWAHQLPDGLTARAMVYLSEHLRIFSNAGEGIVRQFSHNVRGHGAYILGKSTPRAFWYYFPVALTMKLSLLLLLLPLLLTALKPKSLSNWACWTAAGLLAFTLLCRVQIGVRLVLPLVVFGVVGLGAAVAQAWQSWEPGWKRRLLGAATLAGIAWTGTTALRICPDGICYTNELWGGTERGYLCLSDSNYDWGQGLRALERWERRHGLSDMNVWYFGTDPVLKTLPVHPLPLHTLPINAPADLLAAVRGHYLAVSTTFLYGSYTNTKSSEIAVTYLRACLPVDRTTTFLIYDFRNPEQQPGSAQAANVPATTEPESPLR
jgi:hypothetical protein